MSSRRDRLHAPFTNPVQTGSGVQLLSTECRQAAWAVVAHAVERVLQPSEPTDEAPIDVARQLQLELHADALGRVLLVRTRSGHTALLSLGKLVLMELAEADVNAIPSIVYGTQAGPVSGVVLKAAKLPVLVCNPEWLRATALGQNSGK